MMCTAHCAAENQTFSHMVERVKNVQGGEYDMQLRNGHSPTCSHDEGVGNESHPGTSPSLVNTSTSTRHVD